MEYSQKPIMNVAPAAMMPMPNMPMPNMPMPNMVSPISAPMPNQVAPIMKPPHHGNVSVSFVNVHEEHCCPKGPAFSSTGVILVLFILLVIISRAKH
ncbi:hypothetical protein [Paenibacillus mesophilus]|uniref:hypothetical protein n=1 Tax=Paenibacillus mesophilus TaxID=2582849 RepID=UPI001390EEC5|nr:hypothetical protein [Paenibacillus mesophilus]